MDIQNEIKGYQEKFKQSCDLLTTGERGSEKRFKEESLLADSFIIAADRALQMVMLPDEERLEVLVRKVAVELYYAEGLNERIESSRKSTTERPVDSMPTVREDLVEKNKVDPNEADLGKTVNPHSNS